MRRVGRPRSAGGQGPVQVAVVPVRVVEDPTDEVVDVVAVRDRLVGAPGAMALCAVDRSAGVGTAPVDLDPVLVDVARVPAVKMPVVKVVRVVPVPHRGVAASRTVLVVVASVCGTGHRRFLAGRIASPKSPVKPGLAARELG